jgi:hypothetical protein
MQRETWPIRILARLMLHLGLDSLLRWYVERNKASEP